MNNIRLYTSDQISLNGLLHYLTTMAAVHDWHTSHIVVYKEDENRYFVLKSREYEQETILTYAEYRKTIHKLKKELQLL